MFLWPQITADKSEEPSERAPSRVWQRWPPASASVIHAFCGSKKKKKCGGAGLVVSSSSLQRWGGERCSCQMWVKNHHRVNHLLVGGGVKWRWWRHPRCKGGRVFRGVYDTMEMQHSRYRLAFNARWGFQDYVGATPPRWMSQVFGSESEDCDCELSDWVRDGKVKFCGGCFSPPCVCSISPPHPVCRLSP